MNVTQTPLRYPRAADYGCFLVYETLDCSGESRRFENLDQVEDFLVNREQSGA